MSTKPRRMPRVLRRRSSKRRIRITPGAAPGQINIDPDAPKPVIDVLAYSGDDIDERKNFTDLDQLDQLRREWPVVWINVSGLGDKNTLRRMGEEFEIHSLAMEDVVNVTQRPKVEPYENLLFIVARMIRMEGPFDTEQVSLFLGEGFVLTFQEVVGDCFDPVRERLRKGRGRIRKTSADYLAYALLDAIVDSYFPQLEVFGDRIENLEQQVLTDPRRDIVRDIHRVRQELLLFRRIVWPTREALSQLTRDEHHAISDETRVYLRDCYDHAIQLIDMVETFRELASGLMDIYLSSISNRMNEIMKVLTIFAAIFIPLGFLAGLYGMNFNPDLPGNMPETQTPYGYIGALVLMAAVAGVELLYFWHKGWIGNRRENRTSSSDTEENKSST